ncbi:DNA alkylation repair protein [Lachnospiraceae bacterium 62-35]
MAVRKELMEMADEEYRDFHSSLLPGNETPVLGIRMPLLRKKAKELAKGDWRTYLQNGEEDFYEEVMLKGLVTGMAAMDLNERFGRIREFVPKIHNWAVCDGFCSCLKFSLKHKDEVWEMIKPYLESNEEYEIRFAVVMMLDYFADEAHAEEAFSAFETINHTGYYVKMAVAWALSVYFIKAEELTMAYLKSSSLDDWTYNKALQKIIESYRVDEKTKKQIRSMKRRKK